MALKTIFKWNKSEKKVIEETAKNDRVLLFMANEAKKLMDPYTPGSSLVMSRGSKTYTERGKGIVEYPGPYARFQYYGKVMVGVKSRSAWANKGESKTVTGANLQYSKFRHPLATSKWDNAMKIARGKDLAKATENFIKKG